jgi:hypothetical protein
VSGTITITAPNTDVSSSLAVLPETFLNASSQLRVACAARGGRPSSSFASGGRGGLPPDPSAPLTATPSEQPLKQQTATGSPTALTARPPQAAKPVMVAGTSQPVLGSPPSRAKDSRLATATLVVAIPEKRPLTHRERSGREITGDIPEELSAHSGITSVAIPTRGQIFLIFTMAGSSISQITE